MAIPVITRLRSGQRGMVLIAAALTIVLLIGMLGLAFDLARMYTARNELQAFVDAASIAAAFELNGTAFGIVHAKDKVNNYPGKWGFEAYAPENVTTTFSNEANGTYVETPANPAGYTYVRVTAQAPVRLYFLPGFSVTAPPPALPPPAPPPALWLLVIGKIQTIGAEATSGQFLETGFNNGLIPYSPDALNINDPVNWGLTRGAMHTLRWPPLGLRNKTKQWCDGDEAAGYVTPNEASDRGFIDIAGNGAAAIRDAIVNNKQTRPLYVGDVVVDDQGNRGTESDALRERHGQDRDSASLNYAEYMANINDPLSLSPKGNGRRFVIVPIRNPWNNVVLGFGGFFLHGDVCMLGGDGVVPLPDPGQGGGGGQNSSTCCAEFVGPAIVPGRPGGGGNTGAYSVRLFK